MGLAGPVSYKDGLNSELEAMDKLMKIYERYPKFDTSS
jgi:hypothetical protein